MFLRSFNSGGIARMGYFDYTVVTGKFEMQVPNSDLDGMAG
ncbi:hypothetical protein [Pseudarthrobacter albicanus]|nr:hypothetical protein [Pseudarthrobacter albicanus]